MPNGTHAPAEVERPEEPVQRHTGGQTLQSRVFFRVFGLTVRGLKLLGRVTPRRRRASSLKRFTRGFYQVLSLADRRANMVFMNYGYAPLEGSPATVALDAGEERDRYCIQLYHRAASALDLRGRDVLEVGCGRGGGAAFVMKYLQPRSLTGVDFAGRAIAFCHRQHRQPGLSFRRGDAEKLPFANESFDVVLNVESSHCYPSMERFLAEVVRVLRPGGYLLFADIRAQGFREQLLEQLEQAGLIVIEEEQIAPNVLRALDLDSERKLALIESEAPPLLRASLRDFAAVKDTPIYKRFRTGEWEYVRFVLQKNGRA
ncbi:phthiotriol/phenolphthiotriol dimycocerosates methyltransferase [soil metagenome]